MRWYVWLLLFSLIQAEQGERRIWRIVNDGFLNNWWAVAEFSLFSDLGCSVQIQPLEYYSSGYLQRGQYGNYPLDHPHKLSQGQPKPSRDFPTFNAFDGNVSSYWYSKCEGCRSWLGAEVDQPVQCVRVQQSSHVRSATINIWVQNLDKDSLLGGTTREVSIIVTNTTFRANFDEEELLWRVTAPMGENMVPIGSILLQVEGEAERALISNETSLFSNSTELQMLFQTPRTQDIGADVNETLHYAWAMPVIPDTPGNTDEVWYCGSPLNGQPFDLFKEPCPAQSVLTPPQFMLILLLFGVPVVSLFYERGKATHAYYRQKSEAEREKQAKLSGKMLPNRA